jgi:hypothetical protein
MPEMGHQYDDWRKVEKKYIAIDAKLYRQLVDFAKVLHLPVGRVASDLIDKAGWDSYGAEHQQ